MQDEDMFSDMESEIDDSDLFTTSYFGINQTNMLGQTPIFKAIMNQNSEMVQLLLDSKSDITKKELMNNETVRDSVFRYCPEDTSDIISMEFLAQKAPSIMGTYRRYEAELMLDTLTRECDST